VIYIVQAYVNFIIHILLPITRGLRNGFSEYIEPAKEQKEVFTHDYERLFIAGEVNKNALELI